MAPPKGSFSDAQFTQNSHSHYRCPSSARHESAFNDSDTFIGSTISGKDPPNTQHWSEKPAHFYALYLEKNGRDDDFNRLVTAFRHRDRYEHEIEHIYRTRPDLLARKLADAKEEEEEEDDDNDDGDGNGDLGGDAGMDFDHAIIRDQGSLEPSLKPFITAEATNKIKSSDMQKVQKQPIEELSRISALFALRHSPRMLNTTPAQPSVTGHGAAAHLQQYVLKSFYQIATAPENFSEEAEASPQRIMYSPETDEQHLSVSGTDLSRSLQPKGLFSGAAIKMLQHREKDHDLEGRMDSSPSSQDLSDTTSCSDSIGSAPCGDLTWLIQPSNLSLTGGSSHSFFELEASAVKKLVECYYTWQRGRSGASSGHSSQLESRTSEYQSGEDPKSQKRTHEDAQLSSATDDASPSIGKRRKQVFAGQPRLACHFQKHDPEQYPACGIRTSGFDTIAHVKQHLKRNHERNPNYCPRCKALFVTEAEKNSHILSAFTSPCPNNASSLPEGLSPEMIKALARRVGKDNNLHEQWFTVWDMILPGVPRPQTCTFDLSGDVHVQALALCSYFEVESWHRCVSLARAGLGSWI